MSLNYFLYIERRIFKNKLIGLAEVSINIFDQDSKNVFEVHLSINPGRFKKGAYFLIISVTDKISNASDTLSTEVNVKSF